MTTVTQALSGMGVRKKILSLGAVGVVGSLALAGVNVWSTQAAANATQAIRDAEAIGGAARDVNMRFQAATAARNAYVLASVELGPTAYDDDANRRSIFLTQLAGLEKSLNEFPQAKLDQTKAGLAQMHEAYEALKKQDAEVVALGKEGTPASLRSARQKTTVEGPDVQAQVTDATNNLFAGASQRSATASSDYDRTVWVSRAIMVVTLLLVTAAVVGLALVLSRSILRSVSSVRDSLRALARGDLTVPAVAASDDEIGEMAHAAEESRVSLTSVMTEVAQASTSVAAAAEELTAVSAQVSSVSQSSASGLNEVSSVADDVSRSVQTVASGTEEMTASIREIAKNANNAAGVAADAVQVAERTNATVAKLGDSSEQIGAVVKTITGIAEQTNLLALNATIEAARAGDAGKGFAVVANEVKDLARETSKATEDIGRRVESIQADTEAAVAAISEIGSIIAQINDTQATIANAVEEQTATTNEMGRNIQEVAGGSTLIASNVSTAASGAQQSLSAAASVQEAAGELSTRAQELSDTVARFTF